MLSAGSAPSWQTISSDRSLPGFDLHYSCCCHCIRSFSTLLSPYLMADNHPEPLLPSKAFSSSRMVQRTSSSDSVE